MRLTVRKIPFTERMRARRGDVGRHMLNCTIKVGGTDIGKRLHWITNQRLIGYAGIRGGSTVSTVRRSGMAVYILTRGVSGRASRDASPGVGLSLTHEPHGCHGDGSQGSCNR